VNRAAAGPETARQWSRDHLLARLYDWEHDAFRLDVDFYVQLARRTGGPVLELACGSGRVLSGFLAEGLSAVGVDRSAAMLERAEARLGQFGEAAVTLTQADLRVNFDRRVADGPFPLTVMALDALGLILESEAQLELLRAVRRRVHEGGLLVLDVVHVAPLFDEVQGVPVLQQASEDAELRAHVLKWVVRRLHPAAQTMELHSIYELTWPSGDARRLTESLELRYFSRFELELLLAAAGLEVEAIYGDYDLTDFGDASPRMLVIARPTRDGRR
jgi:SAM-dependent methyltransferase